MSWLCKECGTQIDEDDTNLCPDCAKDAEIRTLRERVAESDQTARDWIKMGRKWLAQRDALREALENARDELCLSPHDNARGLRVIKEALARIDAATIDSTATNSPPIDEALTRHDNLTIPDGVFVATDPDFEAIREEADDA